MTDKSRNKRSATEATFVEAIRAEYGFSEPKAKSIVNTIFDTIEENLINDRDVLFRRIGSLRVHTQQERVSIIPRTKQKILINERRYVSFDPSENLNRALNEESGNPRTYKVITEEEAAEYIEKHKKRKENDDNES